MIRTCTRLTNFINDEGSNDQKVISIISILIASAWCAGLELLKHIYNSNLFTSLEKVTKHLSTYSGKDVSHYHDSGSPIWCRCICNTSDIQPACLLSTQNMGDVLYRPYCSRIGTKFNGSPWPWRRLLTFAFKFPFFFALETFSSQQSATYPVYAIPTYEPHSASLYAATYIQHQARRHFCIVVGIGLVRFRLVC
jgi:hypothetical protein